jgi:hypothetical protein
MGVFPARSASIYEAERSTNLCDRRSEKMPGLIVAVTHRLSQDEALRRIQVTVAQARTQYSDKISDLRESWNGYVGTFLVSAMNQQASGTVAVNPLDVTVQITVPLLAFGFKPMIESRIRDMLTRILA